MHQFLRSLHCISSLTVDNVYCEDEDVGLAGFDPDFYQSQNAFFMQLPDCQWPVAESIEHLAFSVYRNISVVFMALLQSCDLKLMKSLCEECFDEGENYIMLEVFFERTFKLMASIASTLQYLVVEIGKFEEGVQYFPSISGLSVLRSLEFRMFQSTCSTDNFDTSLEILSTRPPTCITVKYDFFPSHVRVWRFNAEQWEELEEVVLKSGEVPKEFRLVLKFGGWKGASFFTELVHAKTPRLSCHRAHRDWEHTSPPPHPLLSLCKKMDLPQELIDQVIDYHEHDPRTLCACSLVASSWTHRAQRHLFDWLYYSKRAYDGSGSPPDFRGLLSFLRSTPVVWNFVHELTLDGGRHCHESYITPSLFIGIVDSLPHLGEISLKSLSLTPNQIGDTSLATEISNRARTTRPPYDLTIRNMRVCGDRPFETMHQFLRPLHRISALTVDNVYCEGEDDDFKFGIFNPRVHQSQNAFFTQLPDWPAAESIEHLAFSAHRNMSAMFMALLRNCDMKLMKSLRVECFSQRNGYIELGLFFEQTVMPSIARTLQYLVVEIGKFNGRKSQYFPSISGLSVLRSLEFRLFQGTCSTNDVDTSLKILSTRPPTCIRVKYDFFPAHVWLLQSEHWRRLEEVILKSGEKPKEFRLVLNFIGWKRSSGLTQKLHSGLPQLFSRGLVQEMFD
ncbi:hypothetical protein NLI96_g2342 [Meripilus lineatus]|uniref:F-box domain-containing protein n=1 Tax=Meripilus lineatus TaxID=2056292 RepID=A0AAD5VB39_9APHY|nr:hypothetical protein NLI96_g2342 [Physisporinus lineatus]